VNASVWHARHIDQEYQPVIGFPAKVAILPRKGCCGYAGTGWYSD